MNDGAAGTGSPAEEGLTRSEEQIEVATQRVAIGKAVLRTVIVVEQRTITVDVAHEEVVLDFVPFDDDETAETAETHAAHLALPDLVLHEEQLVISKRIVPRERVTVAVDVVTEQREVTEDVRAERFTVSGDVADD